MRARVPWWHVLWRSAVGLLAGFWHLIKVWVPERERLGWRSRNGRLHPPRLCVPDLPLSKTVVWFGATGRNLPAISSSVAMCSRHLGGIGP